jgi:integrase
MKKLTNNGGNRSVPIQHLEQQGKVTLAISHNGFEFDYLQDKWVLNRNVTINLAFLKQFKDIVAEDVRDTLVYFSENNSASHVSNLTDNLKLYLSLSKADNFSELGFLTFKGSLLKKDEYKLSVVRGFIRQMRYLGLNGNINEAVYKLTDQWRLSSNEKGVAVLSLDPEIGPFSSIEFEAIGLNAAHKYAEGDLSTERYAVLSLFKATGRRTEQIASLKVRDFFLTSKFTGSPTYVVNIPRIKQRGGRFRTQFKPFGLVKSVGQVIEQHIKESIADVEAQLERKLTPVEQSELPLFVGCNEINTMKTLSGEDFLDFLKSELSHISSSALSGRLVTATSKLKVVSERTGELIHVNPYRFRYTLGTRAAIEGAGTLTIATLLDHSDTQNVGVYVANVPEFAIEISKIMNQPLARYAAAFAGKLVKDEDEANKENAGATRIPLREKDCDVGSCGTSAFCQDYAPIACYLCPKFRPWANAPHHLVLQWLMEEREQLKADTDGDMTVVTINDRAIVAVCQVIKLCQEQNHV